RTADVLLTDTQSNARHYARIFDVPGSKFFPVPIGVDETLFSPDGPQHDYEVPGSFVVFTYATMKPLHGMDVVLDAAALVRDIPVQFFIAGGSGKMLADLQERMRTLSLTNIHHIKWIDFADLPAYIRGADLCLEAVMHFRAHEPPPEQTAEPSREQRPGNASLSKFRASARSRVPGGENALPSRKNVQPPNDAARAQSRAWHQAT